MKKDLEMWKKGRYVVYKEPTTGLAHNIRSENDERRNQMPNAGM